METQINYYKSPYGVLEIKHDGQKLFFLKNVDKDFIQMPDCDFALNLKSQLDEYFQGKRKYFDIELAPVGTEFQKKVWDALTQIPYGEVCSYKDIATKIGNDKASRAVGMANNKNPITIIVPCHRVIGSSGKLVGYFGGLDMKTGLLDLEKANK